MDNFKSYWRSRLTFLDVHYHAAPDAFLRRHGPIECGKLYQALGGGVVLKNHLGSSVQSAEAARELDLPVFGSVVLNEIAGGPNSHTITAALCQRQSIYSGRLLVHLPTFTRTAHKSLLQRTASNAYSAKAISQYSQISDQFGNILPSVINILYLSKDLGLVISSGHASREDTFRLLEAAARVGVPRFMLNQPASPMTGMTCKDLAALGSSDWLYIEQTVLTYLLGYQSWEDFAEVLTTLPNVFYSSDLGQTSQMNIENWRKISLEWFERLDLSPERINEISLEIPLSMLCD